jgi:periplasmic protein TonB
MSRDLFAERSTMAHVPRRSPWTIAGSVVAHAVVLGALLVIPILSALDNFVLHADDSMTFVMPSVAIPPAPRPSAASASAPAINQTAAPLTASDHPATNVDITPGTGTSTAPTALVVGDGRGLLGSLAGPAQAFVPPPPPAPVVPVRPGGDLKPPARTVYVAPTYPPLAKAAHVDGSVILEATIDEAGIVRDIRVLRSQPMFDQAAIDAVRQWRYAPTRLNGVAVPVILSVTVMFTMK